MKIAIIGAGPIGCYAGYLFACSGHEVEIYENHANVGSPIQCTGLLTSDFDKLQIPKESFLINTFDEVDVVSPNNQLKIKQKEYLVCRNKFDNYFANLAINEGVQIFCSHSFLGLEKGELVINDSLNDEKKKIKADLVVAADGPLSPTAKAYGFYHPKRENYFGMQVIAQGEFDRKSFKTFFGKSVCPDLFAWVVPESSSTARGGLAMRKGSREYFTKFIEQQGYKIKEMQAGTIPIYHPKQKLVRDNCYLLGDAAGFVKATTLGGLVPGLVQAKILVDCITNKKDYQKACAPLARKLKLHLSVRKVLDKFSDKDWDDLVSYISQPKLQKVFEKYTRDNPIPLVFHSLIREPRLLKFAKCLLR